LQRYDYGAAPRIIYNDRHESDITVSPWLEADVRLMERVLGVGFFVYGPRFWMFGEVEPLKELQNPVTRPKIIARMLAEYPTLVLSTDQTMYRVRRAPNEPGVHSQYDSPPLAKQGSGRFDTPASPVLYASQDLEVCLHECRISAEDDVYLATLSPTRDLKLLDLAVLLPEENVTEFESLDMAVHMLFLAGTHSYEITQDLAAAACAAGLDGLVYPSYFTLLRTGDMPFATSLGISHRRFPVRREFEQSRPQISALGEWNHSGPSGMLKVEL
jgi:hypothetical protein